MYVIKERWDDRLFNLINYVILTIILLLVLYPLIVIVSSSISNAELVLKGDIVLFPKGITFEAYQKVFGDKEIMTGYKNTILYTVIGTIINVLMTIAAAYPLSRKDFPGRKFIMMFFTFTMFFHGGMIPTYLIIKELHMTNTFWVMVIPNAVTMWNIIIMRTYFMSSIPNDLSEAAFVDGCTDFKLLTRIILPLSSPIIAVTVLFYAVGHWNEFFRALIYLSDENKYPLQLILRQILISNQLSDQMAGSNTGMAEQSFLSESLKYAVIIISSVPVLMLYPFIQKYFVKGMMVGAIKG